MNELATSQLFETIPYITGNSYSLRFDFPKSFTSEQKEEYQFTLVRDFILEHKTLFIEPNVSFPPLSGTMMAYYYQDDKQFLKNNASTLLDFLVLNPVMLKKFQDEKLTQEIKTLIVNTKNNPLYSEKLNTLFFHAIQNTTSVEFLLQCGIDPNSKMNGISALMATKNTGVVKTLIKHGADINTTLELDSQYKYLFGKKVDNKSIFHRKNALEIHSILQHTSIVKLLQNYQPNLLNDKDSYFYKQYEELKKSFSMFNLIREMKRDNLVVLEHLDEFIDTETRLPTGEKYESLIKEIVNKNKSQWLEKLISINQISPFLNHYKHKNDYLLQATHKEHYDVAKILIENQFYQKEGIRYIINQTYDATMSNLYYDMLGTEMSFKHILQGCDIELVKKALPHYQNTEKEFSRFCETLINDTKISDNLITLVSLSSKEQSLNTNKLKSGLIDCLIYMASQEINSEKKEKMIMLLITSSFTVSHPNFVQKKSVQTSMKQKAKKLLAAFPNFDNVILTELNSNFPNIVSELEVKKIHNVLNKVDSKPIVASKKMKI
jgi:hypothetical protein